MYLEEALERIEVIVKEIETKQLPLHEIMKLHEEGQKLVAHSEKLLHEAKGRLEVKEVDSSGNTTDSDRPSLPSDDGEINLF